MRAMDYLRCLRGEVTRFRGALSAAQAGARVPTCPEWDAEDLLWHLTVVFTFWARVIRTRARPERAPDTAVAARPEGRRALFAAFDDAATGLLQVLTATPPRVEVWTSSDDHTAGFVRRRTAHETLVHRLDAEATAGTSTPVDPRLAADGIGEVLEWFLSVPPEAAAALDGPVGRVQATDTGDVWLVRLGTTTRRRRAAGSGTPDAQPALTLVSAGEPSFAVTGPAPVLDAWLWNRPTSEPVTVTGDTSAFDQLAAVVHNGIS